MGIRSFMQRRRKYRAVRAAIDVLVRDSDKLDEIRRTGFVEINGRRWRRVQVWP